MTPNKRKQISELLGRSPNRTPERDVQQEIRNALADIQGLRLWRINGGQGWAAPPNKTTIRRDTNGDQIVTLRNPSRFANSTPAGFSDLMGLLEVPGERPIHVFIEVKAEGGRVSAEQRAFIAAMRLIGCRAGVAHSVAEARAIVFGVAI